MKIFPPDSLVTIINSLGNIDLVVFTGNLTKNQKRNEFESLQGNMDELDYPYFIIPASEELKKDFGLNFKEFWYDLNFTFEAGNYQFLGITSKNFLNDKKDDFPPETISWLNDELIPDKHKILFFDEEIFENTRNWQEIIKPVSEQNLSAIFANNSELPKELDNLFIYPISKQKDKKD